MKTFLSLMGFYVRCCFWAVLIQGFFYVFYLCFFPSLFHHDQNLFTVALLTRQTFLPMMFTFLLANALFMGVRTPSDGNVRANGIPFAEFLLARPVTRRQAYEAVACLFLLIIVAPALGTWAATLGDPSLHLKTYGGFDADAAAISAVFPDTVVQGKEAVVAHGKSFIQGWQLCLVTLGALLAQIFFLLPVRAKVFRFAMVIPMAPYFALSFSHGTRPPAPFVFFVHHWAPLAAGIAVLFAAVQALAWWRAPRIEVY